MHSICLKSWACHEKVVPGHTKCCKIWCSKMQPFSGNQCPISLMSMSLVLRLPREMHLSRSSSNAPSLPLFLEMPEKPSPFAHFRQCIESLAPATRNGIRTSKRGPRPSVFNTFDFEMRFAPQRRHDNVQKCSDPGVLCAFWLGHVLRATTACNFSSLIWPDGSALAALASLVFDPPEPRTWDKHSVSRLCYLFAGAPASSFFSLFLFSDLLSSALLFSDSSHLCFSICTYCRKFDS